VASTGTYSFSPSVGELVIAAYRRIQVHRSEILTEHLADATTELNLMQVQWSNLGPLIWTVELLTNNMVQGTATYTVPTNVVMMLDVYVSTSNGTGAYSDRIISPLSRTEYAGMPNKTQQGNPTSFWFDRIIPQPTVTLWPVPDGSEPSFSYYAFTQPQDAAMTNAATPYAPYLALDAYVAGLAHRLARIYKPELEAAREADAAKALNTMFTQLVENVPLYIAPTTISYWR
jgi:hypothetical protein